MDGQMEMSFSRVFLNSVSLSGGADDGRFSSLGNQPADTV